MTRSILIPALLLLALTQREAAATSLVGVRVGEHPGHSRIVFDWQQPTSYTLQTSEAGRIELRFANAATFDLRNTRPLRHVRGIEAEGDMATILVPPGTPVRHFRIDGRVVVDIGEPERRPNAGPAAVTSTGSAAMPAANTGAATSTSTGAMALASTAAVTSTNTAAVTSASTAAVTSTSINATASASTAAAAVAEPALMPAAEEARPLVLAQLGAPETGLPPGPLSPQRAPAPSPTPAQPRPAAPPAAAAAPATAPAAIETQIRLEAGTGRLVTLPSPAAAVMAADPRVVRVQPSSPTSIFLMAGAPGRTTIIATNEVGQPITEYSVTVSPSTAGPPPGTPGGATPARIGATPAAMEAQLRTLIPAPGQVRVRSVGERIVLSGTVPTAADARRAEAIVRGMGVEDVEVLNELAVLSSIQVNLRVRVAEISRDVTREIGFNWSALGRSGNFTFGLRTGAFLTSTAVRGDVVPTTSAAVTGGRFGGGFSSGNWDANGLVDALARENLVTILAEPNLTAQSGEVASFLAGGEFPTPVSAGNTGQIGIEFKPFGVSLAFVPIVLSNDRLTLRVRPEVSELSDQGAISVPLGVTGGVVRIPALTVRRAETTVELGSGQSFAIAGLLQRGSQQTQEGVNGLVDIPVLGALFRSDRFQRRETELVIIVTPYLVQPVSDPAALTTANDQFRPATSLDRILTARQVGGASRTVPGVPPGLGFRLD